MGHIIKLRQYPDASFRDVTAPNADTLYTTSFFDVGKEPWILSIPDMKGRYFLMPMLDGWTTVFQVPGKRTTGTGAQTFAVVGPHWQGQLPKGMDLIKSPTSTVFLIGRTQTNGKADYAAVHKFQDGLKAVPLSRYGKAYTPPNGTVNATLDMSAPSGQVHKMGAATFFATFAELLKANPPHANDYPILARMQRIGIEPGKSFSLASASPEVRRALEAAVPEAQQDIEASIHRSGVMANGWRINLSAVGTYGTDYLQRAGIAYAGLGANTIQDAVYPTLFTDTNGEPLRAERRYQMHFDKDQIPPVRAFWSLTMYDERQLFAANPIDRYAIGDRDKLAFNPDGSLDLYVQRDSPGADKESNWLPTPASGNFTMNLRLYWPKWQVIDGTWVPPPVLPVEGTGGRALQ